MLKKKNRTTVLKKGILQSCNALQPYNICMSTVLFFFLSKI